MLRVEPWVREVFGRSGIARGSSRPPLCVCSICEVCRYMCSINVCRVYMCCIYACTAHILVARTCVAWTCSLQCLLRIDEHKKLKSSWNRSIWEQQSSYLSCRHRFSISRLSKHVSASIYSLQTYKYNKKQVFSWNCSICKLQSSKFMFL